jgi:hypothetical protein
MAGLRSINIVVVDDVDLKWSGLIGASCACRCFHHECVSLSTQRPSNFQSSTTILFFSLHQYEKCVNRDILNINEALSAIPNPSLFWIKICFAPFSFQVNLII